VRDFIAVTDYSDEVAFKLLQPMATGTDQFTSVRSRVIDEPYHRVEAEDILVSALGRSSTGAVSQYQVVPSILVQGDMNELASTTGVTGAYIYDLAAANRFGTRLMQAVCPWDLEPPPETAVIPRDADLSEQNFDTAKLQGTVTVTERALAGAETVRLYYLFRDAAEFVSGSLTIRARPEIRIGDRILLPSAGNLIVYVESVQHSYRFGQAFATQIGFSRGQPLAVTTRLAAYDEPSPTIKVGAPGVMFQNPNQPPQPGFDLFGRAQNALNGGNL
jgi:hypothetical protein